MQPELIDLIASTLLDIGSRPSSSEATLEATKTLLASLVERHPTHIERARLARASAGQQTVDTLIEEDSSAMAFVNAYSADSAARIRSISPLLDVIGVKSRSADGDLEMEDEVASDKQSAIEKLQLLLADSEQAVVEALYSEIDHDASTFIDAISTKTYVESIAVSFQPAKVASPTRIHHLRFIAKHLSLESPELQQQVFGTLIGPNLLVAAKQASLSSAEWDVLIGKGHFRQHELLSHKAVLAASRKAKSSTVQSKDEGVALNTITVDALSSEFTHGSDPNIG